MRGPPGLEHAGAEKHEACDAFLLGEVDEFLHGREDICYAWGDEVDGCDGGVLREGVGVRVFIFPIELAVFGGTRGEDIGDVGLVKETSDPFGGSACAAKEEDRHCMKRSTVEVLG